MQDASLLSSRSREANDRFPETLRSSLPQAAVGAARTDSAFFRTALRILRNGFATQGYRRANIGSCAARLSRWRHVSSGYLIPALLECFAFTTTADTPDGYTVT